MASGQEIEPEKEFDIIVEYQSGATAKAMVAVLEFAGEHLLLGNDIFGNSTRSRLNIKTMTQKLYF